MNQSKKNERLISQFKKGRILSFVLIVFCLLQHTNIKALPTTLTAGDIAIIGVNYDATPYQISIVNLVTISAGTVIRITDYGYDESTLTFGTTSVANTAEGSITWTTTSVIAAGTVIKFSIATSTTLPSGPVVTGLPGTVSVTGWTNTTASTSPSPAGGDNWFIFQGSSATSVSTFVFAWANPFPTTFNTFNQPAGQFLVTGSGQPNNGNSYLPASLTLGTSAIALNRDVASSGFHGDNNVYTGTRSGTKASILAAIGNTSNWLTNETTAYDISSGGTYFPGAIPFTLTILPLKWLSVTSNTTNTQYATINWKVAENNVAAYIIERATDGIHWLQVGSLNAKGDGDNSYTFTDAALLQGNFFYRIKQVDKNGMYTYSSVIEITGKNKVIVSVYPNPASNILNITVSNNYLNTAVQLYNLEGRLQQTFNIKSNQQPISISTLPNGIYTLKFNDGIKIRWVKR